MYRLLFGIIINNVELSLKMASVQFSVGSLLKSFPGSLNKSFYKVHRCIFAMRPSRFFTLQTENNA